MAKSLSTQENKKSRSTASSNAKGGRGRRNILPSTPQNSTPTTSPPSERRATRNVAHTSTTPQTQQSPAKPPSRTLTAAERKATPKISPTPATNAQSNKKNSQQQPPILSLASSEGAPLLSQEITSPNTRVSKHSYQFSPHSTPPLLKSQKRGAKRHDVEGGNSEDDLSSRASKRVRLQHQPFQSPPPPTIIPAILRQQVIKTPEDKIVVFQKGEFLAVRNENGKFMIVVI